MDCCNLDCLNGQFGKPKELPVNHYEETGSFYCSAECKASDLSGTEISHKPRTVKEMQDRLQKIKANYLLKNIQIVEKKD